MKIITSDPKHVLEAARVVGVVWVEKERRLRSRDGMWVLVGTLKPGSRSIWRRRGIHRRKLPAVCFHGYERFLAQLFLRDPKAQVESRLTRIVARIAGGRMTKDNFLDLAEKIYYLPYSHRHVYGEMCAHL